MQYVPLKKGLDIPLAGAPRQEITTGSTVTHLAVCGCDYNGMKPSFAVSIGDKVKKGQLLFEDKKTPGVKYTSPGGGIVTDIVRGDKRAFRYVQIELDSVEDSVKFDSYPAADLTALSEEAVKRNLVESGLWTAFRTRPFSRVPSPQSSPHSLFVTAIDTNPHAPDPKNIVLERAADFENGLKVLTTICGTCVYLCKGPTWDAPGQNLPRVETVIFDGPHPAGLAGTHIHLLDPVSAKKTVWYIGYQDVLAIGKLFTTGELDTQRIVSIVGPLAKNPRLVRTRLAANLAELVAGEVVGNVAEKVASEVAEPAKSAKKKPAKNKSVRTISGSVLAGRTAISDVLPPNQWLPGLGRYHHQITVMEELSNRYFFGWMAPGLLWHSVSRTVASYMLPRFPFRMTTAIFGGHRTIFPYDQFENVMPMDLMPVQLFRSLAIGEAGLEQAMELGMLELDEEDLGLCTYIDPGKNDFGRLLRNMLTLYIKEEM